MMDVCRRRVDFKQMNEKKKWNEFKVILRFTTINNLNQPDNYDFFII